MKISKQTCEILKSYSQINPAILITPGNMLKTISAQETVSSEITVTEEFSREVGIYDLNKLLGIINLFKSPNIDFKENYLVISEENGKNTVKFVYTNKDLFTFPKYEIELPSVDFSFTLKESEFVQLMKAASILQVPHFVVEVKNKKIDVTVKNTKENSTNDFSISVGETELEDDSFVIKIENISKLIPLDYEVKICKQGIVNFSNSVYNVNGVNYWVALEI